MRGSNKFSLKMYCCRLVKRPSPNVRWLIFLIVVCILMIGLTLLPCFQEPSNSTLTSILSERWTAWKSRKIKSMDLVHSPILLNITDFTWIMNTETMCSSNKSTEIMLILVHSAREHTPEREVIRKTWVSMKHDHRWEFRVVFLLGLHNPSLNSSTEAIVKEDKTLVDEHIKYGDLVMGSFVDSYFNLTYKHLMGYKWTLQFCSKAAFVWKIDDDAFIDLRLLTKFRMKDVANSSNVNLYCSLNNPRVVRDPQKKWYVSPAEFPDDAYPTYCAGWAYGIAVDLMAKIYAVHRRVKFLYIDDAFVTGILPAEAIRQSNNTLQVNRAPMNSAYGAESYMHFCEKQVWNGARVMSVATGVRRSNFERNMNCLMTLSHLESSGIKILPNTTIPLAKWLHEI